MRNKKIKTSKYQKTSNYTNRKTTHIADYFPSSLLLMLLLLVAMVFAPAGNGLLSGHHELLKSYTAGVLIPLMMLWWLYQQKAQKHINHTVHFTKYWMFALWLFGTVSIFWSVNTDFTINKWLLWTTMALLFILSLRINYQSLVKLAWGLFIIACILSAIGIAQYFEIINFIGQAVTPGATFSNKNFASQVIVLMAPIGFYLLFKTKSLYKTYLILFGITIIILFIFYTQTRAAWLAVSVEITLILLYLWLVRKHIYTKLLWHRKKYLPVIASLIFLLIMVNITKDGWQPFWQVIADKIAITTQQGGDSGRFNIWAIALQMWQDNPIIGTGLGTFFDNMANGGYDSYNTKGTQRAHNDLVELSTELGLLGILLFSGAVISLFMSFVSIIKTTNQQWQVEQIFYTMLMIALAGSFVNLLFSSPYQHIYPNILFVIYSALLISAQTHYHIKNKIIKLTNKKWLMTVAMGLVLTFLVMIIATHQSTVNTYYRSSNYIIKVANNNVAEVSLKPLINTPSFSTSRRSFLEGLFASGKYQASIYMAKDILRYWPKNHTALFRISLAYIEMNNYDKANIYLEKLKAISPAGDYRGHTNQMIILLRQDKKKLLKQQFNKLVNKDEQLLAMREETYRILFLLGINLDLPEQQVIYYYKQYNKHNPSNIELEFNLAKYYLAKNQLDKAIPAIKNSIKIQPNILKFKEILQQYQNNTKSLN